MYDLIKINGNDIQVKEYQGKRVVTFKEIDKVHGITSGYAKRNFYNNQERFIKGTDYFKLTRKEFGVNFTPNEKITGNPNLEIYLITESGYLMLVKSLTDDLSWQVQRQLVDTYFRVTKDPMLEMMLKDPIMAIRYNQIQMENRIKENESKTQLIETRLNSIDGVNIQGDDQQKLNAMIRKYALNKGILYNIAWNDFKQSYNAAFHSNIELAMTNHCNKYHLKKITLPQYLKIMDKLPDALRVADKMLNAN